MVLNALSRAIWGLFWSIPIHNWIKENIVDQNLEGARTCSAPSGSATEMSV